MLAAALRLAEATARMMHAIVTTATASSMNDCIHYFTCVCMIHCRGFDSWPKRDVKLSGVRFLAEGA